MITLIDLIDKWLQENKDLNFAVSRFAHTDQKGIIVRAPLNLNRPLMVLFIDEAKVDIKYPKYVIEASDPQFFNKLREFLLKNQIKEEKNELYQRNTLG